MGFDHDGRLEERKIEIGEIQVALGEVRQPLRFVPNDLHGLYIRVKASLCHSCICKLAAFCSASAGEIPFTAIDQYATRFGIESGDEFDRFFALVRVIDEEWLKMRAEKAPKGCGV